MQVPNLNTSWTRHAPSFSRTTPLQFHFGLPWPTLLTHRFDCFSDLKVARTRWSPGYAGIIGDEKAVKMAKQGTRLKSVTPGTSITFAGKHIAEITVQEQWREEWERLHDTSSFDVADINPPTCKLGLIFGEAGRESYGRLT